MSHDSAAPALRGRRLIIAKTLWVALVVPAPVLCVVALYARYLRLDAPPDAVRANLAQLGLSTGFYAAYHVALGIVFAICCFTIAAVIVRRKPDDGMALFVSLFLVLLGAAYGPNAAALEQLSPALEVPARFAQFLIIACQFLFFFVFPDGRFVPSRARVPVLVWIALLLLALLNPEGSALAAGPGLWGAVLLAAGSLAGVGAQIYRYRWVSGQVQRQQTKWVVFGATTAAIGFIVFVLPSAVFPSLTGTGPSALVYEMLSEAVATFATMLVPLSLGVAILRYRLWDIDIIINRTLVYGALTASVIAIYVLVVGGLGALLQARSNLLVSLLATALVAVVFAPLRERLQRVVNRLMYGERDDPYAVLSRLGRRLEASLSPEEVLPAIVENIAPALRLPHVAIWLTDSETLRLGAAHGDTPPETVVRDAGAVEALRRAPNGLRPAELGTASGYGAILEAHGVAFVLPLTHRGELVGVLCMAPRGPGDDFSAADRQLLRDLATQSGAAADAVRLTAELRSSLEDLRRSRERLVAAQEEERRRIQRDLHDGLGPVLASMRLRLEACLDAAQGGNNPMAGDLERLYELVGQATGDIRRLVYDLRPPVLDQLGLVPAIRQHCERFSRETGVEVGFEAEAGLTIPSASEVTLLRVVQEALLNVQKHAHASRVDVRLGRHDGWLGLEIRDDGVGFVANGRDDGTGIGSMRKRAELLGGTLRLAGHPGVGTAVVVRIPVEVAR